MKFKTIDRKIIERWVGEAKICIKDRTGYTVIVFAEEGDSEVLGVHALESLMLEYNPVNSGRPIIFLVLVID